MQPFQYRKPKKMHLFTDPSDRWRAFRDERFKLAIDGWHVVLRELDLSGLTLSSFVVDHIAFVQCKFDDTSFNGTHFSFETVFIDCSLKRVDFQNTHAASVFAFNCDFAEAKFPSYTWAEMDAINHDVLPSFFIECQLDEALKEYLLDDGNTVISNIYKTDDIKMLQKINQILYEVAGAPMMKV